MGGLADGAGAGASSCACPPPRPLPRSKGCRRRRRHHHRCCCFCSSSASCSGERRTGRGERSLPWLQRRGGAGRAPRELGGQVCPRAEGQPSLSRALPSSGPGVRFGPAASPLPAPPSGSSFLSPRPLPHSRAASAPPAPNLLLSSQVLPHPTPIPIPPLSSWRFCAGVPGPVPSPSPPDWINRARSLLVLAPHAVCVCGGDVGRRLRSGPWSNVACLGRVEGGPCRETVKTVGVDVAPQRRGWGWVGLRGSGRGSTCHKGRGRGSWWSVCC